MPFTNSGPQLYANSDSTKPSSPTQCSAFLSKRRDFVSMSLHNMKYLSSKIEKCTVLWPSFIAHILCVKRYCKKSCRLMRCIDILLTNLHMKPCKLISELNLFQSPFLYFVTTFNPKSTPSPLCNTKMMYILPIAINSRSL